MGLFLFCKTSYFLVGIGVVPNHFRVSQFTDINFKVEFGFPVVSFSCKDIHVSRFSNPIIEVSCFPTFIGPFRNLLLDATRIPVLGIEGIYYRLSVHDTTSYSFSPLTFKSACIKLVVIVAAARGEGEHGSKYRKGESPDFHCFHFAKHFNYLNFVWQSYRKSHEKAPDKTEKVSAEVKV